MDLSLMSSSNSSNSTTSTNNTSARKRTYSSSSTFTRNAILTSTTSSSSTNSIDVSSTSSTSRTIYSANNDDIASVLSPGKKQRLQSRPDQEIYTTTTHHHIVTDQSHTTTTTTNILNIPSRAPSQRNVPAFLHKLYNMVGDESTSQLIRWSKTGHSFLVEGHEEFAKSVLPRFYKHNTFASFVRQLNMYDFHKVPHIQQGVLVNDAAENEVWEFSHPNFRKNRPDLLVLVTRKRNRDRDDPSDVDGVNLRSLVKEISAIRQHQSNISADLRNLHRDNEIIWKETLAARENHQKHQQVITKILQFLTVVFSNEKHQLEDVLSEILSKDVQNDSPEFHMRNALSQQPQSLASKQKISHGSSEQNVIDDGNSNNANFAKISLKEDLKPTKNTKKATLDLHNTKKALDSNVASLSTNTTTTSTSSNSNVTAGFDKDKSIVVARRSAEAITDGINELQDDVETLAAQLGIDPASMSSDFVHYGSFSNDYSAMISSATENDKLRLYELANRKNSPNVSPQMQPSNQFDHTHQYSGQDVFRSGSVHMSSHFSNTSSQPENDNHSTSYVFRQFAKTDGQYHLNDPLCSRGTNIVGAHVNKNCTNNIFQSNVIPSVTNNNGISSSLYNAVPVNNTSGLIVDPSSSLKMNLSYNTNNYVKSNDQTKNSADRHKGKGVCIDNHLNNRLYLSSVMADQQLSNQKFLNLQMEHRSTAASSPIPIHASSNNTPNIVDTNTPPHHSLSRTHPYSIHSSGNTLHNMPQSTLPSEHNNNPNDSTHHQSFHNVHQLEQYINVMNSSNNNETDYSQHIAEASHYMNQNENKSKKEDGTIVY